MRYYYLSNLYHTQLVSAATLGIISVDRTKGSQKQLVEALLVVRGSKLDCY